MTADVEQLPLPEPWQCEAGMCPKLYSDEQVSAYACAYAANVTYAKDARIEALRAEVERLQEIVRPKREEECLTLDHWRMRAYDLEASWSRCSRACANEQTKRIEAEAYAERLAEALREARHYIDGNRFPGVVAKIDALNPTAAQGADREP